MNEEQINKMIADTYEESRAVSIHDMVKDFYNRKMYSVVIFVWTFALICIGAAVVCGIMFANTSETKMMILYATLFLVCVHWIDLMKIFAWQFIHRNGIKREIKRLEIRIAELSETVKER